MTNKSKVTQRVTTEKKVAKKNNQDLLVTILANLALAS